MCVAQFRCGCVQYARVLIGSEGIVNSVHRTQPRPAWHHENGTSGILMHFSLITKQYHKVLEDAILAHPCVDTPQYLEEHS